MSTWYRIKVLLIFAILGPVVGGLVACPITACLTGSCIMAPADPRSGAFETMAFCLVVGPMAGFVLGTVPAVVTGAILAWIAPPAGRPGLMKAAIVSTMVTAAYGGIYFSLPAQGGPDREGTLELGVAMLAAGVASGLICWWFANLTSPNPRTR